MRNASGSCIVLIVGIGAAAWAKEPANPRIWEPQVRSVAVFKNGMGFFVAEGSAGLHDGWCISGAVPPALFGTLAVYATGAGQTVDLVGAGVGEIVDFEDPADPSAASQKAARLGAYLNLSVQLTLERGDATETRAGRLSEVSETYAILKTGADLVAVPLSEIRRLQVLGLPLRVHVDGPPPDGTAELGLAYLRKGITWIPEYSLRILDDQMAELTLCATLVNEVADLTDCDIHFVVGVPSFLHADFLSPLAVGQAIRTVAATLPEGMHSQIVSNAIMSRAGEAADSRPEAHAGVEEAPQPMPTGGDPLAGLPRLGAAGADDFTVYTQRRMSVRQGEKAVVTLFVRKVAYRHAYRWESPGALRHMLLIDNATDTAWTTGPVVAVSGPLPLCEDLLKYTARGGTCELPVTTAINLATDASESEIDRKLKAHEPSHNVFLDLVTVEGRLLVRNHEQRPVKLTVRQTVPGLLTMVSGDGRMQQDTSKLKLLERSGTATWELELPAGGERVLTYRYERYVESR